MMFAGVVISLLWFGPFWDKHIEPHFKDKQRLSKLKETKNQKLERTK